MITAAVALFGFAWGLVQYGNEQNKNRSQQKAQFDRDQETAEREFMKPWLDAQRETYREALQAVATIANTDEPKAKKQAVNDFWRLYQGKMILVETQAVLGAMIQYGNCLTSRGQSKPLEASRIN
jgi:hypothetical protein